MSWRRIWYVPLARTSALLANTSDDGDTYMSRRDSIRAKLKCPSAHSFGLICSLAEKRSVRVVYLVLSNEPAAYSVTLGRCSFTFLKVMSLLMFSALWLYSTIALSPKISLLLPSFIPFDDGDKRAVR